MLTFATVEDLESGWRELTNEEQEIAQTLLERASAKILQAMRRHRVEIDVSDEVQTINLTAVTCNMVKRVFNAPGNGVQSISQGIGATSASMTLLNADESLYMSKSDRESLGLVGGMSRYRSIQASTYADEAPMLCPGVPFSLATMKAVDNG